MSKPHELLYQAIARNATAVLSLPSAGLLHHLKSRFLAEGPQGFYLESPSGQRELVDALISELRPCGVTFRQGPVKAMFAALPLVRNEHYPLNPTTEVEALLMAYPQEVKVVQRRAAYRVRVRADDPLRVRLWRIAGAADLRENPPPASELPATLLDLAMGGIAVMLEGRDDAPVRVAREDRLRIELSCDRETLLLEGALRHPDQVNGGAAVRVGIEFGRLEDTLEGRQTLAKLTRLVGELQRVEARRHWIGELKS